VGRDGDKPNDLVLKRAIQRKVGEKVNFRGFWHAMYVTRLEKGKGRAPKKEKRGPLPIEGKEK